MKSVILYNLIMCMNFSPKKNLSVNSILSSICYFVCSKNDMVKSVHDSGGQLLSCYHSTINIFLYRLCYYFISLLVLQ